jgi:hypothetical protein
VIHLAGFLKFFKTLSGAASGSRSAGTAQLVLVHESVHPDIHHDAQGKEREQY